MRKVGLVLIGLSFLVSLNPYILLFVVPFFLLGVVLVWLSGGTLVSKLLWTFLPLVLWYPVVMGSMYAYSTVEAVRAQKLDFIFTEDFQGSAIVVENMPCGQPIQRVDGREQLYVPANGILLYQGALKDGYVNHRYFRRTAVHGTVPLPPRNNYMYSEGEKNQPNSHTVGAWLMSTGSRVSSDPSSAPKYCYMNLMVSSKDSLETRYDLQDENRFDAQVDSLVRCCRPAR